MAKTPASPPEPSASLWEGTWELGQMVKHLLGCPTPVRFLGGRCTGEVEATRSRWEPPRGSHQIGRAHV